MSQTQQTLEVNTTKERVSVNNLKHSLTSRHGCTSVDTHGHHPSLPAMWQWLRPVSPPGEWHSSTAGQWKGLQVCGRLDCGYSGTWPSGVPQLKAKMLLQEDLEARQFIKNSKTDY